MTIRTVCLEKAGHRYLFRYAAGLEDDVVEEMMHQADNRDNDFDWMDAATLSFQVTEAAAEDCLGVIKNDSLTLE